MTTQTKYRPSPAMVVAMLALFVAIGGTAAGLPGQNKVNSGDVRNETLKSEDLKDAEAVQSSDVIDESIVSDDVDDLQTQDYDSGSVENSDLATDAVSAAKISVGAVQASEIFDGQVGTAELAEGSVTSVKVGNNAIGSGDLATITQAVDPTPFDFPDQDEGNNDYLYGSSVATCPAGTLVVGGGGRWSSVGFGGTGGDELQAITESTRSGNGWIVWGLTDVDDDDLEAVAYCLAAGT